MRIGHRQRRRTDHEDQGVPFRPRSSKPRPRQGSYRSAAPSHRETAPVTRTSRRMPRSWSTSSDAVIPRRPPVAVSGFVEMTVEAQLIHIIHFTIRRRPARSPATIVLVDAFTPDTCRPLVRR